MGRVGGGWLIDHHPINDDGQITASFVRRDDTVVLGLHPNDSSLLVEHDVSGVVLCIPSSPASFPVQIRRLRRSKQSSQWPCPSYLLGRRRNDAAVTDMYTSCYYKHCRGRVSLSSAELSYDLPAAFLRSRSGKPLRNVVAHEGGEQERHVQRPPSMGDLRSSRAPRDPVRAVDWSSTACFSLWRKMGEVGLQGF